MFGSIKGYEVLEITKKTIEKKKWSLEELENIDSEIIKKIEEVLESKGFVFAFGKKINKRRVIKGIYIFKLVTNEDGKILIFDKKMFVEDISEEIIFEFEDALDSVLGSAVSEKQVHKVIFGEKEFEIKKIKIGKYEVSSTLLWIIWGIVTWILTKNVMWLCLGVVFGSTLGYVVKVNGKKISTKVLKRKIKKKTKKKEKIND